MGPHSFECGNLTKQVGAAGIKIASMGPHSFECGNVTARSSASLVSEPLQWGRTRSSAEMYRRPLPSLHDRDASMGPHSFECGNPAIGYREVGGSAASMGPHSFECGNLPQPVEIGDILERFNGAALVRVRKYEQQPGIHLAPGASMGPHSFECGNETIGYAEAGGSAASMGPHSFECGNSLASSESSQLRSRFNGAALVRVRK